MANSYPIVIPSGASGFSTSDILFTEQTAPSGFVKADGTVYLQATYPQLYARTGLIANTTPTTWNANIISTGTYNNGGGLPCPTWATSGLVTIVVASGAGGASGCEFSVTVDGGTTWSKKYVTGTAAGWYTTFVGVVGSTWVTGGTTGAARWYATSTDNGTTWTQRTVPAALIGTFVYGGVSNGTTVVMVDTTGNAVASTDGLTWSTASGLGVSLYGLGVANNVFFARTNAAWLYSTDGITWASTGYAVATVSPIQALPSFQNNVYFLGTKRSSAVTGPWTSFGYGGVTDYNIAYVNGNYVWIDYDGANYYLLQSTNLASFTLLNNLGGTAYSLFNNAAVSGTYAVISYGPNPSPTIYYGTGATNLATTASNSGVYVIAVGQYLVAGGAWGLRKTSVYTYLTSTSFAVPTIPVPTGTLGANVVAWIKT